MRELVCLFGVELAHLLLEMPGADARHQHFVGEVLAEHGRRRVPVGREDHPAGVDDRAVEVEEDDGEAHGVDAIGAAHPHNSLKEPPYDSCMTRLALPLLALLLLAPSAHAASGVEV